VNIDDPNWKANIGKLSACTGMAIDNCATLLSALAKRRAFFKSMGAVATDHGARSPYAGLLGAVEADAIFSRALAGNASADDAMKFTGHLLMESAAMSIEDGLVMQLHVGVHRNHNRAVFEAFGPENGSDIPITTEFVSNLFPLLNRFGSDPRLTLVVFTMDESSYSRELAPLAGHYPALRVGPPWWFHDSPNGMSRYFDQIVEGAGLCNTAGFNDDTRAFPSIPARHDVWRRCACNWIAGLLARGIVGREDAAAMAYDAAYGLAGKTYKLEQARAQR
jgi:glucuronate isomerase